MPDQESHEKKYMKIEKISEGSYGVVYKARNVKTGEIVAIKTFKNLNNEGIPVSCIRQLQILNTIKTTQTSQSSQLTLKLYDVYQSKNQIQMVVEWMDQTLNNIIKSSKPYDTKKLFKNVLKSVLQLHQLYIVHRDIKPANIMINYATGILIVLDYGMSKEIEYEDRPMTNQVGSLYYRAPELLLGTKFYDFSIDVWSLGCLFYQMLTKKVLFKGQNQIDQVKKIFKVVGTPKTANQQLSELMKKIQIQNFQQNWTQILNQIGDEAFNLLKSMLSPDPNNRPSILDILSHKYFTS